MPTSNFRNPYSTASKYLKETDIPIGIPDTKKKPKQKKEDTYTKLPRIYLKDKLGYRLDTLTTFQNNIYQAELNVRNAKEPMTAEEWRLPIAPVPARPDYSRTEPIFWKSRKGLQKHVHPHVTMKSTPAPPLPYTGADVDDVAFVAESLNRLPHFLSLSYLRQELVLPPKTYFQFAHHVYFHNKYLSETDRREAVYHFPGFCSGCQRYSLCYGCERSSEPHYHLDGRHKHADEDHWPGHAKGFGTGKRRHPLSGMEKFMKEHGLTPEQLELLEQEAQRLMRQKSFEERTGSILPRISDSDADISTGQEQTRHRTDDNVTEDEGIMTDKTSMVNTDDDDNQVPPSGYRSGQSSRDLQGFIDIDMAERRDGTEENRQYGNGDGTMERYRYGSQDGMVKDLEKERDSPEKPSESRGQIKSQRESFRDGSSRYSFGSYRHGHSSSKYSYDSRQRTSNEDDENLSPSPSSKSSNSKRRRLYRAPPPFKIKKRQRKALKSRSPFSTERKYDIPQGSGFQLKKGERRVTEFEEFKRKDINWKPPPKYELKTYEAKKTEFWSAPKPKDKSKKSKKRDQHAFTGSRRPTSPDSGLDSEKTSDEVVAVPADMPPTTSSVKLERISTPTSRQLSTPGETSTTQISDRPKKEKIKRSRKEAKEVERKQSASPATTPVPAQSSNVEPVVLDKSPITSPTDSPSLPPLELPPLPEIKDEPKKTKTKKGSKNKDSNRTQIQTGQKLKPVHAPLPKKNVSKANLKTPLSKPKKRGKSAAEAPVTSDEMKELQDPLDFLKQYCIIHQDRLPFYERIYTNIIECQSPRYDRERPLSPRTGMPMDTIPEWGEHEMNMFHDMIVINRGQDSTRIGLTAAEQYLEKICYTLEILSKKKDHISDNLEELDISKTKKIADRGRELVRDIHRPDYVKKEKKSKKKKKKKDQGSPVQLLRPDDITDAIIVSRIEDKLLKTICKEPEIFQLEVEMQRCREKLAEIDERIVQLDGEKNILGMYCMQVFFMEQNDNRKPLEFRRAQSALYSKLHPHLDIEMNMDELEGALQLINNNLLSDREFGYLFHILNLPGRRKINFQLFSIVAALSEKVTQMDPFIRKLINKMDYNALSAKMDRSKDLFQLLCDGDPEPTPRGNATASNLALELMAGGLTPEHTKYVLSKFNREGTGYVDFLDFVMYIPLFIEIHERIVKDPLRLPLDVC